MNPFTIYLVGIADSFICTSIILAFILLIYFLLGLISNKENDCEKGDKDYVAGTKQSFIIAIIFIICATFTPSTKLLATMIILPEIANSEVIKKDLPEIYDLAVEKLKTELK